MSNVVLHYVKQEVRKSPLVAAFVVVLLLLPYSLLYSQYVTGCLTTHCVLSLSLAGFATTLVLVAGAGLAC